MLRASNLSFVSQAQETAASACAKDSLLKAEASSVELQALNSLQGMRLSILRTFIEPVSIPPNFLLDLSFAEWTRLLYWLDTSGMALYFFDRMTQLGLLHMLPREVAGRLQQNLADNTRRTAGMLRESIVLQQQFQEAGLDYVVVKGVSFTPVPVPRTELRHQFDLDFLVAEDSVEQVSRILLQRGYRLFGASGRSLEFKIHETPYVSLKDLYKDLDYRAVELHVDGLSRLNRKVLREISGFTMPVLSPIDLFVGHAMHTFKDLCSPFVRMSHLLEFYRHVQGRYDDAEFWRSLRGQVQGDPRSCIGIGAVTFLLTKVMGSFAPVELTEWTVDTLPARIRLWIELYGQRIVLEKPPGTKLYLLLQRELQAAGVSSARPIEDSLMPSRLPPPVVQGYTNETLASRLMRYRRQSRYVFDRFCFHLFEGARYAVESHRWQRYADRMDV